MMKITKKQVLKLTLQLATVSDSTEERQNAGHKVTPRIQGFLKGAITP